MSGLREAQRLRKRKKDDAEGSDNDMGTEGKKAENKSKAGKKKAVNKE